MYRVNTVRECKVLADSLISTHRRYPDRQSEPGDTFRGSTAQTGYKYQGRRNMLLIVRRSRTLTSSFRLYSLRISLAL